MENLGTDKVEEIEEPPFSRGETVTVHTGTSETTGIVTRVTQSHRKRKDKNNVWYVEVDYNLLRTSWTGSKIGRKSFTWYQGNGRYAKFGNYWID